MTHISVAYISASTNRSNHAADVSSESLVAYGSSKLVALWDSVNESDRGVFETLPGHEGLVTCVQFIRDDSLVSADDKGTLRCWRKFGSQWITTGHTKAHSKAVSALCALGGFLVTGGSDASVKTWKLSIGDRADDLQEHQVLPLQGRYPLSLALAKLPRSNAAILAIASTDRNVQIWTRSDDVFVQSAVLSGHEDWVRSLAFRVSASEGNYEALTLASGSQDGTIRLWNVEAFSNDTAKRSQKQAYKNANDPLSDDLLDAFEASLCDLPDAEEGGRQISLKRHILTVKDEGKLQQFSITFDALLVGHEAGITSLSWRPISTAILNQTPTLLSTSTDSSLILWSPSTILSTPSSQHDGSTSIWVNRQRFGDIGGQRLGGFVGGLWARDGREAMAWGWAGGWRRWRCDQHMGQAGGDGEEWLEVGAVGGHSGSVKGLHWSPKGEYLISAGADQTTRIHGAIPTQATDRAVVQSWHELSRPQVHGYDLVDVAFIDTIKFVSIADEKVARVFEAPRGFVRVVKGLGVSELAFNENERPLGASVPPLGLSNKASTDGAGPSSHIDDNVAVRRPFEGELASTTLWPETEKVFGHGYESISLAVSNSRRLAATACKATTAEHAVVRVYDTDKWQLVGQPLEGHSLSVTRIAFSPDDRFILSASRDRTWRLFESQGSNGFVPVAADKSHARIIWDCAWATEGDVFATASRDKTVKVWRLADKKQSKKWTPMASIKTPEPATAVAFASSDADGRRRLAVGLETGHIHLYSSTPTDPSGWDLDVSLGTRTAHVDHVYRLAWRPTDDADNRKLATCSEDGTLKILIVQAGID